MEDPQGLELTGTNWPTQTTTPPPTTRYGAVKQRKQRCASTIRSRTNPNTNPPPTTGWGSCTARQDVSVVIAGEPRPAPFRTRKLRPPAPMVLHPPGCGRVGHRRAHNMKKKGRGPTPPPPTTGDRMVWGLPTPHGHPHDKPKGTSPRLFPARAAITAPQGAGIARQVRGGDRGLRPCWWRCSEAAAGRGRGLHGGGTEASHALTVGLRRCAAPGDALESFRGECGRRAVIAVVRLVTLRTEAGPTATASMARAGRCVDDR